jgi:hypothetical protein
MSWGFLFFFGKSLKKERYGEKIIESKRFPHSMPIFAIDINILTFYRYGNNKKKKDSRGSTRRFP